MMPTVFRTKGYRFFFYSNEGNEPKHIHVEKAGANCKLWLEPEVKFEYSYGYTEKEQSRLRELVRENLELIKTTWDEYFE